MSVFLKSQKSVGAVRALALILLITSLISTFGCGKKIDALDAMNRFVESYGVGGVVFAPKIAEGERGYVDKDFFETLYGQDESYVEDFAVLLLSGIREVGECAFFKCYSAYDAMIVCDMCRMRIETLKNASGSAGSKFLEDAFIVRSGSFVVMCALSDNDMAKKLWDRII